MQNDGPVFQDQVDFNRGQWYSETITYSTPKYEPIPSRSGSSVRWARYAKNKRLLSKKGA